MSSPRGNGAILESLIQLIPDDFRLFYQSKIDDSATDIRKRKLTLEKLYSISKLFQYDNRVFSNLQETSEAILKNPHVRLETINEKIKEFEDALKEIITRSSITSLTRIMDIYRQTDRQTDRLPSGLRALPVHGSHHIQVPSDWAIQQQIDPREVSLSFGRESRLPPGPRLLPRPEDDLNAIAASAAENRRRTSHHPPAANSHIHHPPAANSHIHPLDFNRVPILQQLANNRVLTFREELMRLRNLREQLMRLRNLSVDERIRAMQDMIQFRETRITDARNYPDVANNMEQASINGTISDLQQQIQSLQSMISQIQHSENRDRRTGGSKKQKTLENYSVAELKERAAKRKINVKGLKKDDIIAKLRGGKKK